MSWSDFWSNSVDNFQRFGEEFGTSLGYLSDAFLGTNFVNNKKNIEFQQATNAQNERLMREAWSREDNAVQRRVADLKAAGLSPTLAAGSAAASSGPISLRSPQSSLSYRNDLLTTLAATKSLEKVDLENDNLRKQGRLLDLNAKYYGMPDWLVAGNQIFGADDFMSWLKGLGAKVSKFFDGKDRDKPSFLPNWSPEFGFTKPGKFETEGASYSKPKAVPLYDSLKDFADVNGKNVSFPTVADARKWFLSIGGTTAEWYNGLARFKSAEAFISDIIYNPENYSYFR